MARGHLRNKKKSKKLLLSNPESFSIEQDDHFYFIAGYTEGGAPYGVTWEEHEAQSALAKGCSISDGEPQMKKCHGTNISRNWGNAGILCRDNFAQKTIKEYLLQTHRIVIIAGLSELKATKKDQTSYARAMIKALDDAHFDGIVPYTAEFLQASWEQIGPYLNVKITKYTTKPVQKVRTFRALLNYYFIVLFFSFCRRIKSRISS